MPKIVDADAQRREIREAARKAFGRHGAAATGLAHVAAAAGMGRSSLYHYYPDKASLLRDLLQEALDEETAMFVALLDGDADARTRIASMVRALGLTFDEWGTLARALFDMRLRDTARYRPFFRKLRALLASVIAEGQGDGSIDAGLPADTAAGFVIGAIDGLLFQRIVDPRAFPDTQELAADLEACVTKVLAP